MQYRSLALASILNVKLVALPVRGLTFNAYRLHANINVCVYKVWQLPRRTIPRGGQAAGRW